MKNQNSHWITIPEEDSPLEFERKLTPFQHFKSWLNGELKMKKKIKKEVPSKDSVLNLKEILPETDPIKHKWFWASGFVAIMIFTALLFAPQEFSSQFSALIKGSLFSGVNEQVEKYDGINLLPPFPDSEADLAQQEEVTTQEQAFQSSSSSDQVVQAGAEAVNVQVDPVPIEVDAVAETLPIEIEVEVEAEEVMEIIEEGEAQEFAEQVPQESSESQAKQASLAAQQALIEQLTQELEAFKHQSQTQATASEEPSNSLFPAAEGPYTSLIPSLFAEEPSQITAIPLFPETFPSAPSATDAQNTMAYRLNPHQVTVTPQEILAQNQAKMAAHSGDRQAVESNHIHPAEPDLLAANQQLAQVHTTPESGPMFLLWMALALGLFVGFRTLEFKNKKQEF